MPPRTTQNSRSANTGPPAVIVDPEEVNEEPEPVIGENPVQPEQVPEDSSISRNIEDESTPNLAEAILLMTNELRRRENTSRPTPGKVKEPDTFDGSDPRKLNNFILLCNLYFRNNPSYSDDEPKVTFALSYLRGTALEYFEPSILDSDDTPYWMDNWSAFLRTLRTQFGPVDPTADAENGIDNLKMHDNHRILKYNVDFNRFAAQTGWNDSVLRHRYYTGLAERIKDVMGQQGKPATLEAMKLLAHSIDSRHWERAREKFRSDKGKSDSSKSDQKSDKKASNSANNNPSQKYSQNNKSGKPAPSSGNSAGLSDKLGKDGKLTPQERQRRFDNNLCMFCGKIGHVAKDCLKSSSSASKAKGRSAQAKEKEKEASTSKKD